jgi:sugar phosphate isomerase/epimerase
MLDLSFQLYSARKAPALSDVLTYLSQLGYKQVEGYGGLFANLDAKALRADLDRLHLSMPTAHVGFPQVEDVAATAATAKTIGIKTIFVPALQQRVGDDAHWKNLGATLLKLGDAYAPHGIGIGWHNHHFEFAPTPTGSMPLDLILGASPKIQWEADVAWIVKGGQDPVKWLMKYVGQLAAVHVKDIAKEGEAKDEDGWADVGHGTLDWKSLLATITGKTKAKYFVMEHDNPSDPRRFAERSLKSMRAMGY